MEIEGRKYNLDKLGGAKSALRKVSSMDVDPEVITMLKQRIKEHKKARKGRRVDEEISRLMRSKLNKEAEDDAIMTLLLTR